MACNICGSPSGTAFQMCHRCIAKSKSRHSERLENMGFVKAEGQHASLFQDSGFQISGAIALSLAVFCYILLSSAGPNMELPGSFRPAAKALCWCVTSLTWLLLWMRVVSRSTLWGVASFFIPPLAYRSILIGWRDSRAVFFVHIFFLAASLAVTFDLSNVHLFSNTDLNAHISLLLERSQEFFSR